MCVFGTHVCVVNMCVCGKHVSCVVNMCACGKHVCIQEDILRRQCNADLDTAASKVMYTRSCVLGESKLTLHCSTHYLTLHIDIALQYTLPYLAHYLPCNVQGTLRDNVYCCLPCTR